MTNVDLGEKNNLLLTKQAELLSSSHKSSPLLGRQDAEVAMPGFFGDKILHTGKGWNVPDKSGGWPTS